MHLSLSLSLSSFLLPSSQHALPFVTFPLSLCLVPCPSPNLLTLISFSLSVSSACNLPLHTASLSPSLSLLFPSLYYKLLTLINFTRHFWQTLHVIRQLTCSSMRGTWLVQTDMGLPTWNNVCVFAHSCASNTLTCLPAHYLPLYLPCLCLIASFGSSDNNHIAFAFCLFFLPCHTCHLCPFFPLVPATIAFLCLVHGFVKIILLR